MLFELSADGFINGLYWLPFVLGVGLLYKNMKTIDISIDGIAIISIITFVKTWHWRVDEYENNLLYSQATMYVLDQDVQFPPSITFYTVSFLIATLSAFCCAVLCYIFLYVFIHKLKINAIFAGIIFSFILYAVAVLAIGESLSLSSVYNYKFFNATEKFLPFLSLLLASGIAFFYRTKLGLSIRAMGENEKANGSLNKKRLLLRGFIVTGILVGYGSFCYAVKEDCARSGGGFDFVINSLSSFLLVDKLVDFFISVYKKKKNEEEIVKNYFFLAFMQNAVVKAVIGSILFQTLSVIIIHYTETPVLWKLFLGLTLIVVVARIEIERKHDYVIKSNNSNRVVVDNVSFSYTAGHEKKLVFEEISAIFEKGINIIRGENGIGKTTLLKLINNELPIEKGFVEISSENKTLFYLRQDAVSGCAGEMTVYENVINILPDIGKTNIVSVNRLIRMVREKVSQLELDFDFLDNQGIWVKQMNQLSGGQIQKMSCLMAFLSNCGIILADEPTSGLDDGNVAMMKQFFDKLKELGKNVIIVSHDGRIIDWEATQYRMTKNNIEIIK